MKDVNVFDNISYAFDLSMLYLGDQFVHKFKHVTVIYFGTEVFRFLT